MMVEGQLRPNGITDPALLAALSSVERERFVPVGVRGAAYVDAPINIGNGRNLIEPMLLAKMLQAATLAATERVLHICCGSGYGAAISSRLVRAVVALESDATLFAWAQKNLSGLDNVQLVNDEPSRGYPEGAPYDVIIIEGAMTSIPPILTAQLAEHGRLVSALTGHGRTGSLVLFERVGAAFSRRTICDAWLKPIPGGKDSHEFVL